MYIISGIIVLTIGVRYKTHYYKYGCVACHGPTGLGAANLKLANAKYPDDSILVDVINHPYKYNPDTYMPEWDGIIKPEHFPDLIAHVRILGK
ncbi:MAG: hypothetical protein HQ472_06505 [Ignavibacteria bacterium]|nr:hypothetical protein [Ignavibacteria bacterium]